MKLQYLLPWRRRAEDRDLDEELTSIVDLAAEEAAAGGAAPDEARYTARRALGNLALAKENARAVWGWNWLESLLADLRYAVRVLRRDRAFTAVAVLSLGLGIGANAAIFSLIDAVLLRMLPVKEPERLVRFGRTSLSYLAYERFAAKSSSVLSDVIATATVSARDLDAGGGPLRGRVELVSGNFFPALGVQAVLGRSIAPDDDRRGGPAPVAVLSYRYWQRQYGAERSVLGRTIRIQKAPFTIVGVAPPEFFGVTLGETVDVWAPLTTYPSVFAGPNALESPNWNFLMLLGRLQPGISPDRASQVLTPVLVDIQLERNREAPADLRKRIRNQKLRLIPAPQGIAYLRNRFSDPLNVVFAMVGIALLLACANIMSLQFARAAERRKELTVRLAIGASRRRVVRQLLTESLLVAAGGGLLGLLISEPAAAALASLVSAGGEPVYLRLGINTPVLLFVLSVSFVSALIFGVWPAWRATCGDLTQGLQQGARSSTQGRARRAFGRSLAAAQLALCLVLVTGACLFAASLHKLTHFDVGLERARLMVLDVDALEAGYEGARAVALNGRLLGRLAALPGVESASFSGIGVYDHRTADADVEVEGFQPASRADRSSLYDRVGPRFFTTLGARLTAGRDFTERDDALAPGVAIVNEEFVRHYFGDRTPLGRTISIAGVKTRTACEVVGVVRNIRRLTVRDTPERYVYVPQAQTQPMGFGTTRFLIRAKLKPAAMAAALRNAVRAEDSALRIESIETADQLLNRSLDTDRLIAALSSAFGVLALMLAAAGIYGLLSYDAARRTGEFGIRMALGAGRAGIARLMLRDVAVIAVAGVAMGAAAALALGRLVASLVFGLEPSDPWVLLTAAAILVTVAFVAAWWPARRAARLDPMAALRSE